MFDFMPFVWVLIPLLAILVGGFTEWLKFKTKQEQIRASTHDLGGNVTDLRARLEAAETERDAFRKRLQNLEAIVTSPAFEALERPAPRIQLPETSEEEDAMRQADQMARRLNGLS